jgi:hypothetical protein
MTKRWILPLALCLCSAANAQVDSLALRYASTITQQDLRDHLTVLASDAFEGRETGQEGQRKASAYIREQFARFGIGPVPDATARGLVNGYEQKFALEVSKPGGLGIQVNGKKAEFGRNYFYFSDRLHHDLAVQQVLFAGHGNSNAGHDDYAGASAQNAVVLVLEGLDRNGTSTTDEFFEDMQLKAKAAGAAGARVLLIASARVPELVDQLDHFLAGGRMRLAEEKPAEPEKEQLQTIVIDQGTAEAILGGSGINWKKAQKLAGKKSRSLSSEVTFTYKPNQEDLSSTNVLGYIEGSDKRDEIVVVTAHYDHIGVINGEVL